jgi:hypothetical protein
MIRRVAKRLLTTTSNIAQLAFIATRPRIDGDMKRHFFKIDFPVRVYVG